MLTLSFDIHRFVRYKFVPQGQTETTGTTLTCYDVCGKMCCECDLRIGIQGDCLLHCDNVAFLCMNFWLKKNLIIISYFLCSVALVLYGFFIFPKL